MPRTATKTTPTAPPVITPDRPAFLKLDSQTAAAENVHALTETYHLTQQTIADRCGVNKSTICRIAKRIQLPSPILARKIGDLLQKEKTTKLAQRAQNRQRFLCLRQRKVKMRFETSAGPGVSIEKDTLAQFKQVVWRLLSITVLDDGRPPLALPANVAALKADIDIGVDKYSIIKTRALTASEKAALEVHEIDHMISALEKLKAAVLTKMPLERPYKHAESDY